MPFPRFVISAGLAGVLALSGCMSAKSDPATPMAAAATATLAPTAGNTASGTVAFYRAGDHLLAKVRVTGLKPNTEHGFHVHEKGDCSAPDATSAGGHFNPAGQPHGPQDAAHHAGDLPSLKADASGVATAEFHLMGVSIGAGGADITGRGVILHADPDDFKTQPTGNSGARIACGVIAAS